MGPAFPANMSKQGLSARLYAPNQTPIVVKAELLQGILAASKGGRSGRGAGNMTPPKCKTAHLRGQMGGQVPLVLGGSQTRGYRHNLNTIS